MAQKKGKRYGVWIIVGLLFVGLLGFGTGNLGGNITTIGSVGDKELRISDYQRFLNAQVRSFEGQTGNRISIVEAQQLGLTQIAQSQLIAERAIDNEVSNIGLSIGDALVREEVLRVPGFRGISGDFDREVYRSALRQNGLTEAEFETSIREELSRTLLQGAVAGGLPAADIYADTLAEFIGAQRDFVWAEITDADIEGDLPEPRAAELAAFYDANPDLFTAPETRDITYAWLVPDMIQDQLTIDETALRATYEERIAEFVTPERRLVERLAFLDDDAASAGLARIEAGEIDFDGLVVERGLDLADIDLGDVSQSDLGAAAEGVFAAEVGGVVGPLPSDVGPALFRMNAVLAAQEVTFEEAAPDLREELAAARARRVIDDSSEQINDLLAGGATLEVLAERTDMQLGQIDWSVESDEDVAAYDVFRIAAATAQEGDFAQLERLPDGGLLALRLNGITPPTLRPQADVADELVEAYRADAQRTAIFARAKEIAAELAPLSDLASFGVTATIETGQTRQSFIAGTPPGFMTEVFEMEIGQNRVIDNGDTAIVVRLDGISPADDSDPQVAAQRAQIAESVTAGIANDLYGAFAGDVQLRTNVVVDQNALNLVHNSIER